MGGSSYISLWESNSTGISQRDISENVGIGLVPASNRKLELLPAATQVGISVDVSLLTTGTGLDITGANALTTGNLVGVSSNSADTGRKNLVDINNANVLANDTQCLHITQESTDFAIEIDKNTSGTAMFIDADANSASVLTGLQVSAVNIGAGEGYAAVFTDGNVGIGTSTPSELLHILKALPVAGDVFARFEDGATGGFISFGEGTSTANAFVPSIRGVSAGENGTGMGILGLIPTANDVLDTIKAALLFTGDRVDGSDIVNSNIFMVRSGTNPIFTATANRSIGINTTTQFGGTIGGAGVIGLANATTVPTGTVTTGGVLYSTGAPSTLHWLQSDGTDVDLTAGGGLAYTEHTVVGPTTMVVDSSNTANNAGLVTLTLPAVAAIGDVVEVGGKGAGGWLIAQAAGQTIHFGTTDTTTGAGGSLASTNTYDVVTLICTTANTDFRVQSSIGSITVV